MLPAFLPCLLSLFPTTQFGRKPNSIEALEAALFPKPCLVFQGTPHWASSPVIQWEPGCSSLLTIQTSGRAQSAGTLMTLPSVAASDPAAPRASTSRYSCPPFCRGHWAVQESEGLSVPSQGTFPDTMYGHFKTTAYLDVASFHEDSALSCHADSGIRLPKSKRNRLQCNSPGRPTSNRLAPKELQPNMRGILASP